MNFVFFRYIGDVENLCLMMNLLRDEARSIQFEAFHVFKVFVANPQQASWGGSGSGLGETRFAGEPSDLVTGKPIEAAYVVVEGTQLVLAAWLAGEALHVHVHGVCMAPTWHTHGM